ncbi:MAG: Fic family protein [Prevotella sp.]|nr:Fic family protein [Prevotella sp.]MBQ6210956.1 Fic family protein [Prevotella sp.]
MKHETIQHLMEALNEYQSLGIADQIDYQKFYLYSLITHSTAIEGSTVTEIENQLLFDEGITAKGRSLQEQMMNIDLKAAYEYSTQLASQHVDVSIDMLKNLSAMVMKNTGGTYNTLNGSFDASKGDLRLVGVTAGIGGRSYMNYQKVPAKLAEYCQQLNESRHHLLNTDNLIAQYLLSFDAHYQLVTIHPWVDGNGRMSRLVMNHLQYEFGLIPVKIVKEDKAEYIQALIDSRERDSLEPFRNFMLEEHTRNIVKEIEEYKKSLSFDPINTPIDPINTPIDPIKRKLYQAILQDGSLNYAEYATIIGTSEATVKRRLGELKKENAIIRVGSNKTGHWVVNDNNLTHYGK